MPIAATQYRWEEEQLADVLPGSPSASYSAHERERIPMRAAQVAQTLGAFARYVGNPAVESVHPSFDRYDGGWVVAVAITPSYWNRHPSTWRIPGTFLGFPVTVYKSHRRPRDLA